MFVIKGVLILLQRVVDALKINLRTVSSVNHQVKAGEPLTSPQKKAKEKTSTYVTLVNLKNVKFKRVFMRWLKKA
jgi:hypothetical protein